jgi:methionine synthase II (cobalamin-independent)
VGWVGDYSVLPVAIASEDALWERKNRSQILTRCRLIPQFRRPLKILSCYCCVRGHCSKCFSAHICQGNYAVGKEYDAQIGHRYFDTGRYKADLVCKIEATSYLIEHDMTAHYEGVLGNRQLGVGAIDVQDPKIESGETVAARIGQYKWLAPEQTIITSSCGFNHLPRHVAEGKLRAMTAAKRILGS